MNPILPREVARWDETAAVVVFGTPRVRKVERRGTHSKVEESVHPTRTDVADTCRRTLMNGLGRSEDDD